MWSSRSLAWQMRGCAASTDGEQNHLGPPSSSLKHSVPAVRLGLLRAADCKDCLAAASAERITPAGNHGHMYLTESQTVWLQVDEMDKAVDVAEKRMNQFGLTPQEIRNRRNWVHATRRTVSLVSGGCPDICAAECHVGQGAMPPIEQGACLYSPNKWQAGRAAGGCLLGCNACHLQDGAH